MKKAQIGAAYRRRKQKLREVIPKMLVSGPLVDAYGNGGEVSRLTFFQKHSVKYTGGGIVDFSGYDFFEIFPVNAGAGFLLSKN